LQCIFSEIFVQILHYCSIKLWIFFLPMSTYFEENKLFYHRRNWQKNCNQYFTVVIPIPIRKCTNDLASFKGQNLCTKYRWVGFLSHDLCMIWCLWSPLVMPARFLTDSVCKSPRYTVKKANCNSVNIHWGVRVKVIFYLNSRERLLSL
jgi:hypothetical protein